MPVDKSEDRVRRMFGEIAPHYDRMNHVLSLNIDRYWRSWTVRKLQPVAGEPILVRQNNVTAATFHPELTADDRVHRDVFGAPIALHPCDAGAVVPCPSNISMS